MNKLALPLSIVALLVAVGTFFYSQSTSDLVYVDVNEMLEGYKRTKIVRAEFEKKAATMKANVDSLVTGWQTELKTYEKERSKMSKKELELKQELLSNKQQQIGNYQQAIQKQLAEEDKKATQTVVNDINDFVKEYGKNHGHDVIFGAVGNGNIMYAKDGTNLTPKLVELLNAEFEGGK